MRSARNTCRARRAFCERFDLFHKSDHRGFVQKADGFYPRNRANDSFCKNAHKRLFFWFAKVFLKAGESWTAAVPLDDKALRYWNVKTNQWQVEGGSYTISVGMASDDIRLQAAVQLAGDSVPLPYDTLSSYRGVLYDEASCAGGWFSPGFIAWYTLAKDSLVPLHNGLITPQQNNSANFARKIVEIWRGTWYNAQKRTRFIYTLKELF